MVLLFQLLDGLLQLATYGLIVWVLCSWVLVSGLGGGLRIHIERLAWFLDGVFEPLLRPVRQFLPPLGGLDLAPMVLLLAFFGARQGLHSLYFLLLGL